jgi:demethoxyubiquinone hydroxylase (CLK1/Coq7/Cat5 family)
LKKWEETLVEERVRPSLLMPLINALFYGVGKGSHDSSSIGIASGLFGRFFAVRICVLLERILEDFHDESLRILNENNIEEKNLRKVYSLKKFNLSYSAT